jgi:hypothetical protein
VIPVPRIWDGETAVILAGGPSLIAEDIEAVRGRARVIAIKDAVWLAPWADAFYCCGGEIVGTWWKHYGAELLFEGLRYTLDPKAGDYASVLRDTGVTGLELDPSGLRTGKNSGYQAINLAVHLGASRIVLLGYDMQQAPDGRHHWFGAHPYNKREPPYQALLELWPSIVEPLRHCGVTVLNASRSSALDVFPRVSLEAALGQHLEAN